MPISFGKIFGKAFHYAFSTNRILPYFVINLVLLAAILLFVNAALDALPALIRGNVLNSPLSLLASFVPAILGFVALAVVLAFAKLFVDAAVTDNAKSYWQAKSRILSASYGTAKRRYLSVLGAVILAGLIGGIVSLVPLVGWLLGIIAGWIFLFVIPAVVIAGRSAVSSLKDSYRVFRKNALHVIAFWLLFVIIGFVLVIIAFIPVLIAAFPIILPAVQIILSGGSLASLLPVIQQNLVNLAVGGVVTAALLAYMEAFQKSALSFFYLSARKK